MPELYNDRLTSLQLTALRALYNNPLQSYKTVISPLFCTISAITSAMNKVSGTTRRDKMFYELGYINMPRVMPYAIREPYNNILPYLQENPVATISEISSALGYTYYTTGTYLGDMYRDLGHQVNGVLYTTRLGFYAGRGWFDYKQLAEDAETQYKHISQQTYIKG
jgi:hypothetical protein